MLSSNSRGYHVLGVLLAACLKNTVSASLASTDPAFHTNWGGLLNLTHKFYRSQWVGVLPQDYDIAYRITAFPNETGPSRLNWGDMSGGIMEGGVAGSLKITPTIAWSTSMLAWGMLTFPEGYNRSGTWETGMHTLRWNTDYLLKTFKQDVSSSKTSAAPEFYIVYQVGNETAEKNSWTRPEDETAQRPAYYASTYNGTSDLAGQLSAALVSTAMVFQASDPAYYTTLMQSAKDLYAAGRRNRASYTYAFNYPCADEGDKVLTPDNAQCPPADELFHGAMIGTYNSTSYRDDLAWAAAWLYKATNDSKYEHDAYRWYNQHVNSAEFDNDALFMSDWNQVIYPAAVLLADLTNNVTFHYAVQSYLRPWLCGVGGDIHYTSGGLAYNDNDNSLAQTMNSAFLATVYAQSISSQAQRHAGNFSADAAESYLCYAERQVHYMLGPNHTYLVGAEGGPTHVYERASSCPADLSVACTASSALYVDTSNPNLPVGGLVYGMGSKSDQLSDIRTPDTTTHVSHAYTVGLTGALAGLNALTSGNSGFSECPAGVGILDSALALCS